MDPANYKELAMLLYGNPFVTTNYKLRPLFTTKIDPDFIGNLAPYALLQIPLFLQIINGNMDELMYNYLLISVNDPDDHKLIDEIIESF